MDQATSLLEIKGLTKRFPGILALSNVDFRLMHGEVHALMGENGAGKSTLIKVLTGVYPKDAGNIMLNGIPIVAKSPRHAQTLGISTVYQEVNLCPNISVAENLYIGREPMKYGSIDWKTMNNMAQKALEVLNLDIDVTERVDSYSVAIQQMVAIARAVDIKAQVLILDEPTSSLDENESQNLFETIRKLKADGMGILFVTHFLEQVYDLCDTITVLKNGELVGEYTVSQLPRYELIKKMLGKEVDAIADIASMKTVNGEAKKDLLKAENLGLKGTIYPFSLHIKEGEVLGLSGLLGSGRTEIAKLLFGVEKPDSGEIFIDDKKVHSSSALDAMNNGLAFCPEDRKTEGIIGDLSVRENIILALQSKKGIFKTITRKEQEKIADDYIQLLSIKVSSKEQTVASLSGGNQQKVILARWLVTAPRLLILDEPTRGIDVGTKTEIQKLVLKLASEGISVLFISSELDETVRCANHVAVLRDRKLIGELYDGDVSQDKIMQTIAGGAE